jgi:hypothetical protein
MTRYKWVSHSDKSTNPPSVVRLRDVGILLDGTLHNPNGYPDDDVRSAVLSADARLHERRSDAAKKAVATRKIRTAKRVYAIAKRITLNGEPIGPRASCIICGRGLGDQQSIDRGIFGVLATSAGRDKEPGSLKLARAFATASTNFPMIRRDAASQRCSLHHRHRHHSKPNSTPWHRGCLCHHA